MKSICLGVLTSTPTCKYSPSWGTFGLPGPAYVGTKDSCDQSFSPICHGSHKSSHWWSQALWIKYIHNTEQWKNTVYYFVIIQHSVWGIIEQVLVRAKESNEHWLVKILHCKQPHVGKELTTFRFKWKGFIPRWNSLSKIFEIFWYFRSYLTRINQAICVTVICLNNPL